MKWVKKEAKSIIETRVNLYGTTYGFKYNRVSVKDQSTRWGSCSSHGNLNFNWKLVLAPVEVMDYVIIHELAHTRQMNHSKHFWAVVAEISPDYKIQRMWLKENGQTLKL